MESEDDSEDDDGFLLSIFKSKKSEKTTSTGVEGNIVKQNVPADNGKDQMHSLDRLVITSSVSIKRLCKYLDSLPIM